jgi:tetratricopeptide (TPR) repeat protein
VSILSQYASRTWFGLVLFGAACAGGPGTQAVTPADIPALRARVAQSPNDAEARFRLAAAFLTADQCDSASASARAAQMIRPDHALGPMVIGTCQEKGARLDLAIATYNDFTRRFPSARGVSAVRAKAQLALRAQSNQVAREALTRETELTQLPPQPSTLAVLPVTIASTDTTLQPLSRGLAELITSDLALIRTVRLLERLQIASLLDELRLGQSQRADPATAARVGRLLRVERMVQGLASLDRRGPVELSASIVGREGAVVAGRPVTGQFRQLLDLEKELVFALAGQLGIQLSDAERQLILRQGPRNMAAFLAYSDGLSALDRGDFSAAAAAFGRAVQADPGFSAAQQAQQAAAAAPSVQAAAPTDVSSVVAAAEQAAPSEPTPPPSAGALSSASTDVASTATDQLQAATGGTPVSGTSLPERQPTPENRGVPNLVTASGLLRIIFVVPR